MSRDDVEHPGWVGAVRPLRDTGRVEPCCLDSWDGGSWYRRDLPLEERARLHEALRVETDLEGHDVPHDRPSERAQLAHHLPRSV